MVEPCTGGDTFAAYDGVVLRLAADPLRLLYFEQRHAATQIIGELFAPVVTQCAFEIIQNDLGKHFDPVIGQAFIECRPLLEAYYNSTVHEI